MKTVKLSKFEVDLKDFITWGDKERIQQVYYTGFDIDQNGMKKYDTSVMTNARYRSAEVCIVAIRNESGENVPFSNDWLSNMSIEDGDVLMAEVDSITTPKKNS